jgi:hypothetical protein
MLRRAVCLIVVLTLALPLVAHAQYRADDSDRQHPREYNDQDSQVLNLVATILWPVGVALEWGVARPLHYVAANSPLFGNSANSPPPLPPEALQPIPPEAEAPPTEIVPAPEARSAPPAAPQPGRTGQPAAPLPPGQPVLH